MLAELETRVARARRRPRRAGDRQHRQRHGVPDRPRRRAAEPRPGRAARAVAAAPRDAELRLTAWHNQVWKPVIAAVNGVCAGGGLHFVADADIVIARVDATFLDPHVSVGQVTAYEAIALAKKSPMEAVLRMALVGRARADDRRAGLRSSGIAQRGGRPARAARATRPRRWPRRSPRTRRPRWRPPSGRCGARSSSGSPTPAGPARRAGGDVGPPRPDRGPAGLRREARAEWELTRVKYPELDDA